MNLICRLPTAYCRLSTVFIRQLPASRINIFSPAAAKTCIHFVLSEVGNKSISNTVAQGRHSRIAVTVSQDELARQRLALSGRAVLAHSAVPVLVNRQVARAAFAGGELPLDLDPEHDPTHGALLRVRATRAQSLGLRRLRQVIHGQRRDPGSGHRLEDRGVVAGVVVGRVGVEPEHGHHLAHAVDQRDSRFPRHRIGYDLVEQDGILGVGVAEPG